MRSKSEYLLRVDHLKQYFPIRSGFKTIPLKAVDDVSFSIRPGETLGLVGEDQFCAYINRRRGILNLMVRFCLTADISTMRMET